MSGPITLRYAALPGLNWLRGYPGTRNIPGEVSMPGSPWPRGLGFLALGPSSSPQLDGARKTCVRGQQTASDALVL